MKEILAQFARQAGVTIDILEQTDSTNNRAAESRYGAGDVVIAERQEAGRGQRGNSWSSTPGENLTFSVVLRPDFLPAERQFRISKAVALAVADMLTVVTPGLPCAPVVRPVFTVGHKTRSTYRNFRASGFVLGCIYAPMILCKLIIAAVTVQRMVIFFSFAYFKGIPFAIVAVQPDMRSHRRGCYKEQRNRQETCNQPFFHVFLLLKFLKTL